MAESFNLREQIHRAVHSVLSDDVVDIDAAVGRILAVIRGTKSWPAEHGRRTVYARVGIWQEDNKVYAALPTSGEHGIITSYGPGDREYEAFRAELEHWKRWQA